MLVHFCWRIVFAIALHLLLHLLKYFLELARVVLALWAQRYGLALERIVQPFTLIALPNERIDIAAVPIKYIRVKSILVVAIDLRVDLVHELFALFQTHVDHQLLDGHQLTFVERLHELVHVAPLRSDRGPVFKSIICVVAVIRIDCWIVSF